jgi:hypothetical protein
MSGAGLDTSQITNQTATLGVTWTRSPTITNDLRFNYSRSNAAGYFSTDSFGGAITPPAAALHLPSSFTPQNSEVVYEIFGIGSCCLQLGKTAHNLQRQINLVDNASIQKRTHALKIGVDYRQLSPSYAPPKYLQANIFFDLPSAVAGTLGVTSVDTFLNETFLLRNLGLYAQDTWRLNPRLVVTYGLRWDVDFAPEISSGPAFAAVTNFSNLSQLALAPPGTPPYSTTFGNLAPRFGVAYQLSQTPGAETVLRGGWGIFYDLASQAVGSTVNPDFYPFGASNFSIGGQYPLDSASAAPPIVSPAQLASGGTLSGFDPKLKLPYTMQWNVAIQHSLGATQTVSASYLGSSGKRLLQTEYDSNVNDNISNALLVSNQGNSDYNALQLQYQRRVSHGLQALASYTWSHSIDTASESTLSSSSIFIRQLGANVNRGSSDFDVRHAVSAGITYDVPTPGTARLERGILGGWSLQNVFQAWSPTPLNVYSALNLIPYVTGLARPDVVPGETLYLNGSQYPGGRTINSAAFIDPPADPTTGLALRQGNLGRNALRGFGAWQWDLGVHRNFKLHESLVLQFRAEMFNVLNHPNFGPPDGQTGDAGLFGLSTRMLGQSLDGGFAQGTALSPLYQIGGPRAIQLALKLQF